MKKFIVNITSAMVFMSMASLGHAHSVWIKPSHTSLSGKKPTSVVIDASVSNDIFHSDMAFGGKAKGKISPRLKRLNDNTKLVVTQPSGKNTTLDIVNVGRKSVAQIPVETSGTYKIAMVSKPREFVRYNDANGKKQFTMSAAKVPADASDMVVSKFVSTVNTFVTNNQTTQVKDSLTNVGLELAGGTHPNDLFIGEKATFKLYLNGKPAGADVKVKVIPANTRHRSNRNEIDTQTNASGEFSVTWPSAGYFLIEASAKETVDATHENSYRLSLTVEVLSP